MTAQTIRELAEEIKASFADTQQSYKRTAHVAFANAVAILHELDQSIGIGADTTVTVSRRTRLVHDPEARHD